MRTPRTEKRSLYDLSAGYHKVVNSPHACGGHAAYAFFMEMTSPPAPLEFVGSDWSEGKLWPASPRDCHLFTRNPVAQACCECGQFEPMKQTGLRYLHLIPRYPPGGEKSRNPGGFRPASKSEGSPEHGPKSCNFPKAHAFSFAQPPSNASSFMLTWPTTDATLLPKKQKRSCPRALASFAVALPPRASAVARH